QRLPRLQRTAAPGAGRVRAAVPDVRLPRVPHPVRRRDPEVRQGAAPAAVRAALPADRGLHPGRLPGGAGAAVRRQCRAVAHLRDARRVRAEPAGPDHHRGPRPLRRPASVLRVAADARRGLTILFRPRHHSMSRPRVACPVLLAAATLAPPSARAQSLGADVEAAGRLATVQALFDAMAAHDAAAARRLIAPGAKLLVVREDGSVHVGSDEGFIEALGKDTARWLERSWDAEVLGDGPLAPGWDPCACPRHRS